eukprot:3194444-Pyramimonas_sp.AAC.1
MALQMWSLITILKNSADFSLSGKSVELSAGSSGSNLEWPIGLATRMYSTASWLMSRLSSFRETNSSIVVLGETWLPSSTT